MTLKEYPLGARVFIVDEEQKVLFTKKEIQIARDRFYNAAIKQKKKEDLKNG